MNPILSLIASVTIAAPMSDKVDVQSFPLFTCTGEDKGQFVGGPPAGFIDWDGSQALRKLCLENGPGRISGIELHVFLDQPIGGSRSSTSTSTRTWMEQRGFDGTMPDALQNNRTGAYKEHRGGDRYVITGATSRSLPAGTVQEWSDAKLRQRDAANGSRHHNAHSYFYEESETTTQRTTWIEFCNSRWDYIITLNNEPIGETSKGDTTCFYKRVN